MTRRFVPYFFVLFSFGVLNAATIFPGLNEYLRNEKKRGLIAIWMFFEGEPSPIALFESEILGGRIRTNSDWIKSTSLLVPISVVPRISRLPGVRNLDLVRKGRVEERGGPLFKGNGIREIDYGPSYDQMRTINAIDAQKEGYFGSDVVIGILDTGFDSTHPAVRHLWEAGNIKATYDFNSGDHLVSPWGNIPLPFQEVSARYIHSFDLARNDSLLSVVFSISPEDSLGGSPLSNPWSLFYVKGVISPGGVTWSNIPRTIVSSDSFATFPSLLIEGMGLFVVWQAARYLGDFDIFLSRIELSSDSLLWTKNISNDLSPSLFPAILGRGDRLWIFWWDELSGLTFTYSSDKGENFKEKSVIFEGTGKPLGLRAANMGDTLVVAFSYEAEGSLPFGSSDSVFVIGSFDGGNSWNLLFKRGGFSPDVVYLEKGIWIAWQEEREVWVGSAAQPYTDFEQFKVGTFAFPRYPRFLLRDGESLNLAVPEESGPILAFPLGDGFPLPPDTLAGAFSDLLSASESLYVWRRRGDPDISLDNYVPHSGGSGFHGTKMLSVIGGYYPGELVGPAPDARFVLAKTEKVKTRQGVGFENQIEEDFWVSGLEWAASQGARILSSSLGYIDWYPRKSELNGRVSPASRAASLALENNVLVVTAMGNRDPAPFPDPVVGDTSLNAPADAFGIIAVGGYESDTTELASWNFGPTADGRIKPELVAPFVAYTATDEPGDGGFPIQFGLYTGTSYSTALVAGVAAQVWQAHPSWSAEKVREALLNTAGRVTVPDYPDASLPNNLVGYGLVDAYKAIYYEAPELGPYGEDIILPPYPNPFRPEVHGNLRIPLSLGHSTPATISIYTLSGERIRRIDLSESERHVGTHLMEWDGTNDSRKPVSPGTYLIVLTTGFGNSDIKKIALLR